MKKYIAFIALAFIVSGCEKLTEKAQNTINNTKNAAQQTANSSQKIDFKKIPVNYPSITKDSSVIDDYFGKKVADPYRWLEDDRSEATAKWVKAQNKTTFSYLDEIPYRDAVEERLQKLWNFERYSPPFKEGSNYYFFKNDGLQNQAVLYQQKTLDSEAKVVLDPNQFSKDGTASLGEFSFSKNGRFMAYQVSEGGSDWRTIYVKDINKDQLLEDKIEWVKFSGISWHKNGFFYCRYPEPEGDDALSGKNEFHQVYYHELGTPQTEDELIFADRAHPQRGFFTTTSKDENYLVVGIWESTSGNALYFKDLRKKSSDFIPLVEEIKNDYQFVDNIGNKLLFLTNYKAPNQRLIVINADKPEEGFWEEMIPESKDVLQNVNLIADKIVTTYIHNASSKIKIFNRKGNHESDLELPGIGTVGQLSGEKDQKEAFYTFASYTRPSTVYALDMESLKSTILKAPDVDFNSDDYITKQIWYKSYDGEKIPMFITHKKGIELNGKNPTLLYGYGGFNISILPRFQITRTVLLENGGIYAVANIRGGGEFGEKWHKAGTKEKKQNVFNDFQAAAEYLIAQKYTSSEKLAIEGRSNGGLLVGACITQRPDLYKVAFPAVGVLDMLRYQNFTIGRAWAGDYGLSETQEGFDYLYSYSPLHNVEKAKYPATLVTTADHDDRVVPAHSFKFISALQEKHQGDNPVLIRVETSAGHGAGKPTSKQIEEAADLFSFMFYNMEEDVIYQHDN